MSEDPLLHEANRRAHRLADAYLALQDAGEELKAVRVEMIDAAVAAGYKRKQELDAAARAYREIELRRQKEATL